MFTVFLGKIVNGYHFFFKKIIIFCFLILNFFLIFGLFGGYIKYYAHNYLKNVLFNSYVMNSVDVFVSKIINFLFIFGIHVDRSWFNFFTFTFLVVLLYGLFLVLIISSIIFLNKSVSLQKNMLADLEIKVVEYKEKRLSDYEQYVLDRQTSTSCKNQAQTKSVRKSL